MSKMIKSKVVGVTKKNDDGDSRQEIIELYVEPGDELYLDRESHNEYDSNAIAVYTGNMSQIGYISGELAEKLAPLMDNGQRIVATVSEVTGGDEGKSYGVNIELTVYTPEETTEIKQNERDEKAKHQAQEQLAAQSQAFPLPRTEMPKIQHRSPDRTGILERLKAFATDFTGIQSNIVLAGSVMLVIMACCIACGALAVSVILAGRAIGAL